MRVLVTGANGFVGSALCPRFSELGHEVVPVVRHQNNIADEVIVHGAASWKATLNGCDSVIHLAARAHVMEDKERNPLQAFRVSNVDTTIDLAKRAVEAGVRRFVFMSTIKMNGEEAAPRDAASGQKIHLTQMIRTRFLSGRLSRDFLKSQKK